MLTKDNCPQLAILYVASSYIIVLLLKMIKNTPTIDKEKNILPKSDDSGLIIHVSYCQPLG